MKIAFTIKAMGSAGGGAERVLSLVAPALGRRGHDVVVITRDCASTADFYSMTDVRRIYHGSRAGGSSEGNLGRANLIETAAWMRRLRRDLLIERPDVAIGMMHSSFLPLGAALLGTGIPVVASEHTVYGHYASHGHYLSHAKDRVALQLTPYLADRTTVVSSSALNSFPLRLRRSMTIVPNPVIIDAECFSAAAREPLVLSVGRLDGEKDPAVLIDAFASVAPRYSEWKLEIAGDGPLRAAMGRRIEVLGLKDRVTLLGAVRNVGALYRRASIYATASHYESFGLATAEAMAHGNAVIGFAGCPGINQLIDHERNGLLLAETGDRTERLSAALACLMESRDRRESFGLAARKSVEHFGLEPTVDLWEQMLRELAAGSRNSRSARDD